MDNRLDRYRVLFTIEYKRNMFNLLTATLTSDTIVLILAFGYHEFKTKKYSLQIRLECRLPVD